MHLNTSVSEVRNPPPNFEEPIVAHLAKIQLAAAPVCPGCRSRLNALPLDDLSGGDEYACPDCGQVIRIPEQILVRLRAQRDALAQELAERSWWQRVVDWFRQWWVRE